MPTCIVPGNAVPIGHFPPTIKEPGKKYQIGLRVEAREMSFQNMKGRFDIYEVELPK